MKITQHCTLSQNKRHRTNTIEKQKLPILFCPACLAGVASKEIAPPSLSFLVGIKLWADIVGAGIVTFLRALLFVSHYGPGFLKPEKPREGAKIWFPLRTIQLQYAEMLLLLFIYLLLNDAKIFFLTSSLI